MYFFDYIASYVNYFGLDTNRTGIEDPNIWRKSQLPCRTRVVNRAVLWGQTVFSVYV